MLLVSQNESRLERLESQCSEQYRQCQKLVYNSNVQLDHILIIEGYLFTKRIWCISELYKHRETL